jgi:excisionase family DNA binding protein
VSSALEPTNDPEILTPAEATQLLRVSRTWLYQAAQDGRIPAIRLGGPAGPVRFVRADLLEHIERARQRWHPAASGAAVLREAADPAAKQGAAVRPKIRPRTT